MKYTYAASFSLKNLPKIGVIVSIFVFFVSFRDCLSTSLSFLDDTLKQQEEPNSGLNAPSNPKQSLINPKISFANKLTGISNQYGVIKPSMTCFTGEAHKIDYPLIIWNEVPGAVSYVVYRKHEEQSYKQISENGVESSDSSFEQPIVRNSNAKTDSCLTELDKVIQIPYYYYADRNLSREKLESLITSNEKSVIREYTYQIRAIDHEGNWLNSNEISITMVPTSAEQAFYDIFRKNLSGILYITNGFRVVYVGESRTQKGSSSGEYSKNISLKSPHTYTYHNYADYKGGIVVNGQLTGTEIPSGASSLSKQDSKMLITGQLSITGPYKATIIFNDLEMYLKGEEVTGGYIDEIDKLGNSGSISILYSNKDGKELDRYTYNLSNSKQRSVLVELINLIY